jgi:hypothetical protein
VLKNFQDSRPSKLPDFLPHILGIEYVIDFEQPPKLIDALSIYLTSNML